ncbi:MAG: C40 family peptidase [Candidatus Helarchaeota archaeon]|nr:C40 family peptidase [Candidatus Helarchaeota archaeon]
MHKKFSDFFENFRIKNDIDQRLTVFEYDFYQTKGSLKIKVIFSDSGLMESFENELVDLPSGIRKKVKLAVLPDKKNMFGLINVCAASIVSSASFKSCMLTQSLLGEKVDILQISGDWLRVRCEDGYIGWVNSSQVVLYTDKEISKWENGRVFLFRDTIGDIKESLDDFSVSLRRILIGSKLPYLKKKGEWLKVKLPDNSEGWLKNKTELKWLDEKGKSIREKIVLTSMKFLGIPYLWGGKSPMGFDCSGFVQTVFSLNGISLPRDSDMQFKFAKKTVHSMKKGDLLFFCKNVISHVGIYIGNKRFIHSRGFVRISSFDESDKYYDKYLKEIFFESRSVI